MLVIVDEHFFTSQRGIGLESVVCLDSVKKYL